VGVQSLTAVAAAAVQVPGVGAVWLVGALFLFHVIFGTFSMGAVVLAPTYELAGRLRGGHPGFERLAHSFAATNLKIFSFGATLAAFAVTVLAPLWSSLFIPLFTIFWLPVLTAFLSWFATIVFELLYVFRWRRMSATSKTGHIVLGYLGAASEHLFLFLIVGVDSFMLTPVKAQSWAAIFNPTFWTELLHRFVGNLSWVSLFAGGVLLIYAAANREPAERAYYVWAARLSIAIGFLLLVPQAVIGWLFAEQIKAASPGAFEFSFTGTFAWLWLLQQFLFGVVLLGANVYFRRSRLLTAAVALLSLLTLLPEQLYGHYFWVRYIFLGAAIVLSLLHWLIWTRRPAPALPSGGGRFLVMTAGACSLFLVLLMGTIRETARGPYTVYGLQTQSQGQQQFNPGKGFYP
jgi:cytochrome bd ubiquinol oxidase subunit I